MYNRKSIQIHNQHYHQILNHPFPSIEHQTHNLILTHILKKHIRSKQEIAYLVKILSFHKSIKDIQSKLPPSIYQDFLRKLKFISIDKDQILFKQGDTGQQYYIILKGQVEVYTTNNPKLLAKLEELQSYYQELDTSPSIQIDNEFQHDSPKTIEQKFENYNFFSGYLDVEQPQPILNSPKLPIQQFIRQQLTKISEICQGESFGEVALTNKSNKRTATIITSELTQFAFLEKEDFSQILKSHYLYQQNLKIDFLNNLGCFNLSNDQMLELSLKLKDLNLGINNYVFKQGENTKFVYIVINGEVQIEQDHQLVCIRGPNSVIGSDFNQECKYSVKVITEQCTFYTILKSNFVKFANLQLPKLFHTLKITKKNQINSLDMSSNNKRKKKKVTQSLSHIDMDNQCQIFTKKNLLNEKHDLTVQKKKILKILGKNQIQGDLQMMDLKVPVGLRKPAQSQMLIKQPLPSLDLLYKKIESVRYPINSYQ